MQKARRRLSTPTACKRTVSGSISLPCSGCFPPFPHGTGTLSVFRLYLALRHGRRRFRQDSTCPALLRCHHRTYPVTCTGLSPSVDRLSRRFQFLICPLEVILQPRLRRNVNGLGSSHFDRHYFGNRYFFLFLQVLRCFSSLRMPHHTMVCSLQLQGFPHSDISGSIPVCKSPELFAAYHVLPRFRKPRHPPFALLLFLVLK